jgi:hypothetical protein
MNMGVIPNTNSYIPMMDIPQWVVPLSLVIPFKGMMLSQEVKMLHHGKDYCVFQAPNQSICSSLKDSVFLHGRGSSQTYIAHIDEINPQRGWITLSSFVILHSNWHDRITERVQPRNPMYVSIRCSSRQCQGNLDNISISGMGVLVYKSAEDHILANSGKNVKIDIPNFDGDQSLRMEGRFVTKTRLSNRMIKIGFKVFPSNKQIRVMEKFIIRRRIEILDELDSNWMMWNEPRSTKDLFF